MALFKRALFPLSILRNFNARFVATKPEVATASSGLCFELTDEQREIQQLSRKFAREEIIPRAAHHDETGEFPWEILAKAHQLGLSNMNIPQQYGGHGLGILESALIGEELAFGCSGISTAILGSGLGQAPVILFAQEEVKKEFLGRLVRDPKAVAGYCVTEPGAGSDVAGTKTRAVRKGDQWVLNGEKMWITNGPVANWYFVLARSEADARVPAGKAFTAFVVDGETRGIIKGKKENMLGQRASATSAVKFEDVLVPNQNVLGAAGAGFKAAMTAFDFTRPLVAAGALGVAQRALHEAAKYALERKTMGKFIAEHQAVAFMLADMAIGIEAARLMTWRSAWEMDLGRRNSYYASIAKTLASEIANKAAADAVQIFGGAGYCKDFPVEKLMRDAKISMIYEGTSQIQRVVISREIIARAKSGTLDAPK